MKFSVLASGSKGNSTYLETKEHKVLIDMGTTNKYIENALMELGVMPSSIDTIFITHDHRDHISALNVFLKKYNPKVYMTSKLKRALDGKINIKNFVPLESDFTLEDLKVNVIKTSHDASDSVGFVFESGKSSLVYITDTGYINVKYFELLKNRSIYIFESNHDVEMLMNGKYRYDLKVRILSDRGHLSNDMSSDYLVSLIGKNTKYVVLAHLSEENNTVEKAYQTLVNKLEINHIEDKKILVASQSEVMNMIEI